MTARRDMSDRVSGRVPKREPSRSTSSGEFARDSSAQSVGRFSRGSYVTRRLVDHLRENLTERDRAVLATVDRLHVLTGAQLTRLHGRDFAAPSADRQCRRALASLVERDLLARLERNVGGVRAGSSGWTYVLGLAGQKVLHPERHARRPWTPGYPFLLHSLLVSELYVRLTEAERTGQLEVVMFSAEPDCWRRFDGPSGRTVLKPDAYLAVGAGEYEHTYFIEVDRGTEAATTLDRKLAVHTAYWRSGTESPSPRVVWLSLNDRRHEALVDACGRQPAEAWPLYAVWPFDEAVERIRQEVRP
jgi:Replication-relaxation